VVLDTETHELKEDTTKASNALNVGLWDTSQMLAQETMLLLLLLVLVLVESRVTLVDVMVTKHTSALRIEETADPFRNKT
jgi:hypothetical protein